MGEIAIVYGGHLDQKQCDYNLKVYMSIESTP